MARLRDLHLEPYSLALARRILEAFPSWEPYVDRAEREEDGLTVYVLQIDVPSANPDVRQPLTILVELDRIVYAYWFPISSSYTWYIDWVDHAIFHPLPPASVWREDPSGFDRIVEWLRGFVVERHVATVWFKDGTWSASGNPSVGELEAYAAKRDGDLLLRSWRGTYDLDLRPEASLPAVIVYGDPDSRPGRLVAEALADAIEMHFSTEHDLPVRQRVILLDPEWNLTLMPSTMHFAYSDGRSWIVKPEDQDHPRLFIVRWEGRDWSGPWEEEGSFEVRNPYKDRELLRRNVLAWLREP